MYVWRVLCGSFIIFAKCVTVWLHFTMANVAVPVPVLCAVVCFFFFLYLAGQIHVQQRAQRAQYCTICVHGCLVCIGAHMTNATREHWPKRSLEAKEWERERASELVCLCCVDSFVHTVAAVGESKRNRDEKWKTNENALSSGSYEHSSV